MAYTNTDTNMTSSSALSAGMQTYYNRELLRTFEPNLVHLQFGEAGARRIAAVVRAELAKGANVIYAGGKAGGLDRRTFR